MHVYARMHARMCTHAHVCARSCTHMHVCAPVHKCARIYELEHAARVTASMAAPVELLLGSRADPRLQASRLGADDGPPRAKKNHRPPKWESERGDPKEKHLRSLKVTFFPDPPFRMPLRGTVKRGRRSRHRSGYSGRRVPVLPLAGFTERSDRAALRCLPGGLNH